MIKKPIDLTNKYLITPSLINAWLWQWQCANGVREYDSDTISLEDKIADMQNKAKQDFINTLNKLPFETNKYIEDGIKFEKDCYDGKTCISPIIENGCYQIAGSKDVEISGIKFVMYGRLDVIKGGVIYDIKKVVKYSPPKYDWSCQHSFYLDVFPNAYKFEYLIFDDKLHLETYFRDTCKDISSIIENFVQWLKNEQLLDVYKNKWQSKY